VPAVFLPGILPVERLALLNDPTVRAAMQAAQRNEPQTIDLQALVCEIPASPFHEERRGLELVARKCAGACTSFGYCFQFRC